MPNVNFQANTPLDGFSREYANTSVRELTGISIISLAKSRGDNGEAEKKIVEHYGASWPRTGHSETGDQGASSWLGLSHDQCFALLTDADNTAFGLAAKHFNGAAYITEQTDSWAMLAIEGNLATAALERICPIDLDPSVFSTGSVTRTVMEHLAVIIQCTGENRYLLLSPTSSAQSFLHAVESSFNNILAT